MADFNTTSSGDIVLILTREEAQAVLAHLQAGPWSSRHDHAVRDALECVLRPPAPEPSTQTPLPFPW